MDDKLYKNLKTTWIHLKEGLIKLPIDEIRKWAESHFEEFKNKLLETIKTGYDTYLNDDLIFTNPYTGEKINIGIQIFKTTISTVAGADEMMSYDKDTRMININASNFFNAYKRDLKSNFISGIVHEMTHEVDPGIKYKSASGASYEDYINSEKEFVAYTQESIDRIKNLPIDKKKIILDKIRFGKKIGIRPIDNFVTSLTPDKKRKFIKLLIKEIL